MLIITHIFCFLSFFLISSFLIFSGDEGNIVRPELGKLYGTDSLQLSPEMGCSKNSLEYSACSSGRQPCVNRFLFPMCYYYHHWKRHKMRMKAQLVTFRVRELGPRANRVSGPLSGGPGLRKGGEAAVWPLSRCVHWATLASSPVLQRLMSKRTRHPDRRSWGEAVPGSSVKTTDRRPGTARILLQPSQPAGRRPSRCEGGRPFPRVGSNYCLPVTIFKTRQ